MAEDWMITLSGTIRRGGGGRVGAGICGSAAKSAARLISGVTTAKRSDVFFGDVRDNVYPACRANNKTTAAAVTAHGHRRDRHSRTGNRRGARQAAARPGGSRPVKRSASSISAHCKWCSVSLRENSVWFILFIPSPFDSTAVQPYVTRNVSATSRFLPEHAVHMRFGAPSRIRDTAAQVLL